MVICRDNYLRYCWTCPAVILIILKPNAWINETEAQLISISHSSNNLLAAIIGHSRELGPHQPD